MQVMTVVSALADGCQRVLRAPVLLGGVWLASVLVPSPVLVDLVDHYVALVDATAMDPAPAVASLVRSDDATLAYAALATFLLGGVLDRLARNRAIASYGFFGACGVFFFRFLRLSMIAVPLYAALFVIVYPALPDGELPGYVLLAPMVILLHVIFDYAKVRMVVEDRRSAVGAVTAAIRFVARHPGATLAIMAVNAALAGATWWLAAAAAIGTTAAVYAYLLARVLLRLIFAASQISLFQGRLAHAGYTARPLPTWPESPAAEAVRPH
jgi:hypothetical protein